MPPFTRGFIKGIAMPRRILSVSFVALALIGGGLIWVRAADLKVDRQKAEALQKRIQKGETISPEEKAALQDFIKAMKRETEEAQKAVTNPVPPATDSTGLVPLTDLGTATYKGED